MVSPKPTDQPRLFGIQNSNRDFTQRKDWGKNKFNNTFPVALACYLHHLSLDAVYIHVNSDGMTQQSLISIGKVLGMEPLQPNVHFSFEQQFTPYSTLVAGTIPGVDVVIQDLSTPLKDCLRALEIKLTTLPDNSTCELDESRYGTELVVRPVSILYIALNIANSYSMQGNQNDLFDLLNPACKEINGSDWSNAEIISRRLPLLLETLHQVTVQRSEQQIPFLLQPIWKTQGKSGMLADNCFDVFIWSDLALVHMITQETMLNAKKTSSYKAIKRIGRSAIWLVKMLWDFARGVKINHREIFDQLSYDTKNDKAFALNGKHTYPYMAGPQLAHPRIHKSAVKQIILGNGQNYLSPERRLDAILVNSPELFQ